MRTMKHLMLATAAAAALALAGCGGGGSSPASTTQQQPTPYEVAKKAIELATTAAAAQKAVDDAAADVSGAELIRLQTAADARKTALATMASAAEQKAALMTAAGMIDTSDLATAEDIAAAEADIAALKAALAAATDVSDADKAMYQGRVTAAETAVAAAQGVIDHAAQTMRLTDAVEALEAIDLGDLSDEAKIDAAEAALAELQAALNGATRLSDDEKAVATALRTTANRTVMAAQGRMDVADQKMALTDAVEALEMIDLDNLMTQAQIDAANEAIIALDLALDAASDVTDAEKVDALTDVTLAKRKVMAAETMLAENVGDQRMALTDAAAELGMIDLEDLDTAEKIADAQAAVDALKMALDGATHLSETAKAMYQSQLDTATNTVRTAQTGMDRDGRMMAQRTAITNAVTMARTAVGMVDDDATDDEVTAADEAVTALKAAIDGAVDLEGDTDVAMAKGTLATLEGQLASAKTSRTAAMGEETRKRNEANAATAAKLYAAISPASGDNTTLTPEARFAEINPVSGTDPTPFVAINYGGELETTGQPNSATLNVDKDTPVADNHGWKGNRYVEKDDDGNVITEAVVYSDEMPMMGAKFSAEYPDTENFVNAGVVTIDTTGSDTPASRVALTGLTRTAGTEIFELPDPNPNGEQNISVLGSFHGVPGTYTCDTGAARTDPCLASIDMAGFTLTGTWTFKPTNPDAMVTESADPLYAVYGWWLRKPAGNGAWTASAFDGYYGAPATIAGLDALSGTATYTGGAAGKYALSSSTGGRNEAGHFTARATLDADFNDETITGTIDNFMGVGGAKEWSVELMESGIGADGLIRQKPASGATIAATDDGAMTKWTIDDNTAAASGHWKGNFREVDTDSNVPAVVTGDFYSEFGNSGKMVGAFGAKTE